MSKNQILNDKDKSLHSETRKNNLTNQRQQVINVDEEVDANYYDVNLDGSMFINEGSDIFKNALSNLKVKDLKKQLLRQEGQQRAASALDALPEVYRRLWDDVEVKSKKSKDLQKHFDSARKLEWLKLISCNNHSSKDPKT